MSSELLKTIFEQNHVEFRNVILSSSATPSLDIFKHSQIDCSVWECESEFFIALNPATHEFDLSRLNKAIGKTLL